VRASKTGAVALAYSLRISRMERVHDALRSGDVLAVWRLDRLGRSLKHLIELMAELEAERIGFQSITESIDTTTPGGKLVLLY
jgi:DNA invertase Pin-like site-specific DNA recombinase